MADPVDEDSPPTHDASESTDHSHQGAAYPWGEEGRRYLQKVLQEYADYASEESPRPPLPVNPSIGWPPLPTYDRLSNSRRTPVSHDAGEGSSSRSSRSMSSPSSRSNQSSAPEPKIPHSWDFTYFCHHGVVALRRCKGPHDTCDVCHRTPAIGWIYRCAVDDWDAGYDHVDGPFLSKWIHNAIDGCHYSSNEVETLYVQKIEILEQVVIARNENVVEALRQNGTCRDVDADADADDGSSTDEDEDQGVPLHVDSPRRKYAKSDGKDERVVDQEKRSTPQKACCHYKCCHNCRRDWQERVWFSLNRVSDDPSVRSPTPYEVIGNPVTDVNLARRLLVDRPPRWIYANEKESLYFPAIWCKGEPRLSRALRERKEEHRCRMQERKETPKKMATIPEEGESDEEQQERMFQEGLHDDGSWPTDPAKSIIETRVGQVDADLLPSVQEVCRRALRMVNPALAQSPQYCRVVDADDVGAWMGSEFGAAGPSTYVPDAVPMDMGLGMDFDTFAEIPSPELKKEELAKEPEADRSADEAHTESHSDEKVPFPEEYIMQSSANKPKGKAPMRDLPQEDIPPAEEPQTSDLATSMSGLPLHSLEPPSANSGELEGPFVNQALTEPRPSGFQLTEDDMIIPDMMSPLGFQPLFRGPFRR